MSATLAENGAQLSSSASSSYISEALAESHFGQASDAATRSPASATNYTIHQPSGAASTTATVAPAGLSYMRKSETAKEKPQFTPNHHMDPENENRFPLHTLQPKGRPQFQQPALQQMSPAPQGNGTLSAWLERAAQMYLPCTICHKLSHDLVQVTPGPVLACRPCGAAAIRGDGVTMQELPNGVSSFVREVLETLGVPPNAAPDESLLGRRRVQVRRNLAGAGATATSTTAASNQHNSSNSDSTAWADAGSAGYSGNHSIKALLEQLEKAEVSERQQIETAESKSLEALRRRGLVSKGASGPTTSRQLKLAADGKYEEAEYTAAIELYTKAIQLQPLDGATNVKMLYSNRSAAQFMTQRFKECVADCLEVVRMDPGNVQMVERAAKAAATMGDLGRAISILNMIPAGKGTTSTEANMAKYKSSLDIFQKAEKHFGSSEGDECYRMLVAQFSDNVHFRMRFAESLWKQKHYLRAVETLEAVSTSHRPPKACKLMSECLYLSGFEYFERARHFIKDASRFDDECEKLLLLINVVDDGKQKGNTNFARKNFAEAVTHYTNAIQQAAGNDQILRILFCNRAAANKELGRYRDGIDDCTKALSIDPDFFKAYARRARCHHCLGDDFSAVRDFRKALEYDRNDNDLAKELREAESGLAKEAEKEKDFYYQLGITRTTTDRDIKLKYRELSLRWHPDKCVGFEDAEKERAEHKFKVINEAYATLSDPEKRRAYDMKVDREQRVRRTGGGFGFASTYSSSDYFRGQARTRAGPGGYW